MLREVGDQSQRPSEVHIMQHRRGGWGVLLNTTETSTFLCFELLLQPQCFHIKNQTEIFKSNSQKCEIKAFLPFIKIMNLKVPNFLFVSCGNKIGQPWAEKSEKLKLNQITLHLPPQ